MNRDDEKVIIGSLQRIAAALEAIAKSVPPQGCNCGHARHNGMCGVKLSENPSFLCGCNG